MVIHFTFGGESFRNEPTPAACRICQVAIYAEKREERELQDEGQEREARRKREKENEREKRANRDEKRERERSLIFGVTHFTLLEVGNCSIHNSQKSNTWI